MKRGKIIAILAAVACIVAGLVLCFTAFAAMDFDIMEMNTMNFVTNTYTIEDTFSNLSVKAAECSVTLLPSEDGSCRVVCTEGDKIFHTVAVRNGTLTIDRTDNRKWYERIGVYWGEMKLVIYLPESAYETLSVKTASGDIDVPAGFSFADAEVKSASGDIRFCASVAGDLSAEAISGDVYVSDMQPKNLRVQSTSGDVKAERMKVDAEFFVKTVSGEIGLFDVSCGIFTAESTSGNVKTTGLLVAETLRIQTVSGDVRLQSSDADRLWISTVSGDVNGSLLTEKNFKTKTASGSVHVPSGTSGGICEVKTTSGDIRFSIG